MTISIPWTLPSGRTSSKSEVLVTRFVNLVDPEAVLRSGAGISMDDRLQQQLFR